LMFPEVMDPVENLEKWFLLPHNRVLDYRNVWLLNPRNFGDSDHHPSFELGDIANDIERFMKEKKLSIVTVAGHGFGAKIACHFGALFLDKVSGVACIEGGPIDLSYHQAWDEVRNYIIECDKISTDLSTTDYTKKVDTIVTNPKWRSIMKQNLIEGKSGGLQWRFNLRDLALNVKKWHNCDITKWHASSGLFPGRTFVQFAQHSQWILLPTNTIPFYKFFPRLEGRFPAPNFNMIPGDENPLNHWPFEYPKEDNVTMSRLGRWLLWEDGVHVLLADRSEVGWKAIPERDNFTTGVPAAEHIPEHLHHNYLYTDAYAESKKRRGVTAASVSQFGKKGKYSSEDSW